MNVVDTPQAGPSVIRGSLLRLGGFVLGTLASVVSSAVVIRHLGVVDTGRYVTVMSLVIIVGTISDLGFGAVGVREYAVKPRDEGRRFLANLLGLRVFVFVIGLSFAVAFSAIAGYTDAMVIGTALAGVGMVLYVVQDGLSIPLHVRLRFGWVAVLQLAFQVGLAIGSVVLVLAGAGLLPFFALWAPIIVPVLILTCVVIGPEGRVLPKVNPPEWRRMLIQILPFSAGVVLSVLYFRVVQIMMSVLSSGDQTGYFGVSFRILDSFTTIPPLLVSTALPILARAAHNDPDRLDYAGRRLAETMLLAGVGTAIVVCLGAKFGVSLVAGSDFGPSVGVLRVLAIALVGTFMIAARGYTLLSLGRMREMLISNVIALVVVFAAGIPLINAHGALGGGIALMTAELTLAASYEVALTRRRAALRPSLGFLGRVVIAAALAIVPALILDLPSLVEAIVGAGIYGAVLMALGAVPPELRQALWPHRA